MRFDLELNKIALLKNENLWKLSSVLYDQEDNTILPAVYDKKTLFKKASLNKGNINTSRFDNFSKVPSSMFPSYILKDELAINDIIRYNSLTYPVLNGGSFCSSNKNFVWSNLYVNLQSKYDDNMGYYSIELLGDPNTSTVSVYTLGLKNPSYIDKIRDYEYVEFSNILSDTFKKSKKDNSFTINNNIVYLNNRQIKYDNIFIGKGNGKSRTFALPEFPAENLIIDGYNATEFSITNGVVVFNKDSTPIYNEDISVSYTVTPVVSYKRNIERDDLVYLPYNINPSTLGLKNGIVCTYNSYSNINSPNNISISSESINDFNNTYKITTRLQTSAGIPITNKKVKFNVISEGALLGATNSREYIATTSMSGKANAIVFGDHSSSGMYIQKEWIDGDTINIPKDINLRHPSDAFLYFITNDDPILGKTDAQNYETKIVENYKSDDISSYYISGRKIAYIEIVDNTSRYIKPMSISKSLNTRLPFRNLSVEGTNGTILRTRLGETIYNGTTTQLVYNGLIPTQADNVVGYYLVFNKEVDINVSYEDEFMSIVSDTITVDIKNIKAESPFTISRTALSYRNTTLDDMGYFSVSDYINNGFGLYPMSYGCIHSDVIGKQCIHANKAFHNFYSIDNNGIFCTHTPETDSFLPEEQRCPGVKTNLINPFAV